MVNGYKMALRGYLTCLGKLSLTPSCTLPLSILMMILTHISMITYPNYKYYWPIRALGLYAKQFGNEVLF